MKLYDNITNLVNKVETSDEWIEQIPNTINVWEKCILKGDMSNNKMERLNGEIRDREKTFRGLKNMDTPVIEGMKVYYNFTKKHGDLNGKTPSEEALIIVDGKNRWKTIIQNASLSKDTI